MSTTAHSLADFAVGDRVRVYLADDHTPSAAVGVVTHLEPPRAWEEGDAGCVYVTFDGGRSEPGYHPDQLIHA